MGRRLQAGQPLTGQRVLDELTTWYRDTRVEGAALDEDADMLLLQSGATRPLIVAEPTDLRERGDDDLKFNDQELKYLDFTRQVHAAGNDEDSGIRRRGRTDEHDARLCSLRWKRTGIESVDQHAR